jgi:hypothetical protein
MRRFKYWDQDTPPEGKIVTEEEILRDYYPHWKKMIDSKYRKGHDFTEQDCVDDWMVVNWAVELKDAV